MKTLRLFESVSVWELRHRRATWAAVLVLATIAAYALHAQAAASLGAEPGVAAPAAESAEATGAEPAASEPIPTRSLLEMILAGGPLMVPILVCSFVLTLVVFERTISLRRGRVLPRPFVKRFLHQLHEGSLKRETALARCRENSSHVARVFAAAVRKWGKPAVEVEQALLDEGERTANELRRYLRVINGVATVCPLLGLLGTVWGMMEAFNAIATTSAIGRPELLAGGISGALVSTAAGLFVAIPALIAYLFFVGRVDRLIMDIDARGQQLVDLISAEGIAERKERSGKEKKAA
jgi:biopolymer transport protein ExbB